MKKALRVLGSARLALALIFILSVFLVVISFGGTDIFNGATFTSVFAVTLALFGVNTAVCTWQRTIALLRADKKELRATQSGAAAESHQLLHTAAETLRSRGYRVRLAGNGLLGDKHRWARWGPVISHAGFLVVLLGFVLSLGLRTEGQFMVTEGQLFESPQMSYVDMKAGPWSAGPPEFSLLLDGVYVSAYDDSAIVAGDLVFVRGGQEAGRGTAETGVPASYRRLAFHQNIFGYTTGIVFEDEQSGQVFPIRISLETLLFEDGERYSGQFALPGTPYFAEVEFYPAVGGTDLSPELLSYEPLDPAVFVTVYSGSGQEKEVAFQGTVKLGEGRQNGGLDVRFDHYLKWLGLTVVSDPGLPVIYLGFLLVTIGMTLTYMVVPMRVLIRIGDDGSLQIKWRAPRFAPLLDAETRLALEKLITELGEENGDDAT